MTTGVACPTPIIQFFDNQGNPAVGGSVLTQVGGVNTATYQDVNLTKPLPNPIPLNSRGEVSTAAGTSSQLFLTPNTVYTFTLSDANGNQLNQAQYVNGTSLTGETIAPLLAVVTDTPILASLVRTPGEIMAAVTPGNYSIAPGIPERYGAAGNGTTDDTTALSNCLAANGFISLTPGKTYLFSGLTINTTGYSIFTPGGTESTATLLLKDGAGNVGLHFIDAAGNTTHFNSGFMGRNFTLTCASGASHMTGIYCDNAEIPLLDGVAINFTPNTYVGTATGNGTIAFYGYFQQDGVFVKCTFTGGSGAYGDGVLLTGSFALNETPNNNLFVGCRAQSCGGWGVHVLIGDGNTWIGGKIQANASGGWSEDTDGLTNGPSNSVIQAMGFEANTGDDLYINLSNHLKVRDVSFESTGVTNHIHAPNFMRNAVFDSITSPAGKPATFSANTGTGNVWKRNCTGFVLTLTGGNVFEEQDGGYISTTYGTSIAIDASTGRWFAIIVSNATAFTIANPTNPSVGQVITFQISNQSGGVMGAITWGAQFQLAGAFTNPANSNHRNISFAWNSSSWQEVSRSPADIAG